MAWEELSDGFYKGMQFHTAIPSKDKKFGISSQKTDNERRLQLIRKPKVSGGGVNDFGGNQDTITVEIVFFGEGHLDKYTKFLDLCKDGNPGILVLPLRQKALVAYYQKVSEEAAVGNGGSIKGTFTFVEDTTIDPSELSPPAAALVENISDKASSLIKKISNAKKALSNNPLVSAVRLAESGLSTVRRYSGAVLALDQAIRARIISISDNILGTLSLAGDALAIFNKPEAAKDSSGTATKNIVDPDTGQEVVPFDQDETPSVVEDPLTPPTSETITEQNTPEIASDNLNSDAGVEIFSEKVAELIKEQREELSEICGGRVDEVSKSLTQVIVAMNEFKSSIAKTKGTPFLIHGEFSIMEIMFHNDIGLERLENIIRMNFHLRDVICIPDGSVVYL